MPKKEHKLAPAARQFHTFACGKILAHPECCAHAFLITCLRIVQPLENLECQTVTFYIPPSPQSFSLPFFSLLTCLLLYSRKVGYSSLTGYTMT